MKPLTLQTACSQIAANTHKGSPQSDWVPLAQFDLEVLFSFPAHAEQSVRGSGRRQVERFRVMPPFFRNGSCYLYRSIIEYLHQTQVPGGTSRRRKHSPTQTAAAYP